MTAPEVAKKKPHKQNTRTHRDYHRLMQTLQQGKQANLGNHSSPVLLTVSCSAAWQTSALKLWFYPCHYIENYNCNTICQSLTMLATIIRKQPWENRFQLYHTETLQSRDVLRTNTAKLLCSFLKYHASPMIPDNHINSFKHYVMTSFKHMAPKGSILDQGITIHHTFMTNLIAWNDLLHDAAYLIFTPNSKCLLPAQAFDVAWS